MKTAGIIAEFNPFHNGHQYLIEQARNTYGADRIVVIMSGDFVQRGSPACVDKYTRCRMALAGGADLVMELPCPGALSSAEGFAASAVSILDSLGIVDILCFGCEDADPERMKKLAAILNEEPDIYRETLKEALHSGRNYPAAREMALSKCLKDTPGRQGILEIIKKPNNILAIEYCRALAKIHSSIRPVPIQRKGAGYHDVSAEGEYVSASAVRDAAAGHYARPGIPLAGELTGLFKRTMPCAASAIMIDSLQKEGFVELRDFSSMIIYALLKERGRLDTYEDVSAQLASRLEDTALKTSGLEELIETVTVRSYTQTRIRRCLFHILLGHTKTMIASWKEAGYTGYVNVLGFHKGCEDLFTVIPELSRQQLILRSADRRELPGISARISENDLFASEVYRSIRAEKCNGTRRPVLSEPILVI